MPGCRQVGRHDGIEDHQILEGQGEPAGVAGPGRTAATVTPCSGQLGCLGRQFACEEAHVDVAPPALPVAVVEPRGTTLHLPQRLLAPTLVRTQTSKRYRPSPWPSTSSRPMTTTVEILALRSQKP
jgi:hypothetical protein